MYENSYSHTGGDIGTVDLVLIFKIICYNLALVGVTIEKGGVNNYFRPPRGRNNYFRPPRGGNNYFWQPRGGNSYLRLH